MEKKFNDIYKYSLWSGDDSGTRSGSGSTRSINTKRNLFLIRFIKARGIKTVYDVCGDCNWQRDFMRHIPDVQYIGMDVSKHAIDRAMRRSSERLLPNMRLIEQSVNLVNEMCDVEDPPNSLFILKEVIQHLPLDDGMRVLRNIRSSGVKYLAITDHHPAVHAQSMRDGKSNFNVDVGEYYPNRMSEPPFRFTNPIADVSRDLTLSEMRGYGNLLIFDLQEQRF